MEIGDIIRMKREEKGLSRAELAEGICTVSYLYMIEMGQRNPSSFVLNSLGAKLSVDLFRHIEFLECKDVLGTEELVGRMNRALHTFDMASLRELREKASGMEDFRVAPWRYLLDACTIYLWFFEEGREEEALERAFRTLEEVEEGDLPGREFYRLGLLLFLTIAYQQQERYEVALGVCRRLHESIQDKRGYERLERIVLRSYLLYMQLCNLTGRYEEALEAWRELSLSWGEYRVLEFLHMIYFNLAYACHKLGRVEEARGYFFKGSCLNAAGQGLSTPSMRVSGKVIAELEGAYPDVVVRPLVG